MDSRTVARTDSVRGMDRTRADEPRMGPARLFALLFGIAYVAVALGEAILGFMGGELVVGGVTLLAYAPIHNIIHWATGVLLLGVLAFGRWPTKMTARTIGFVFCAVFLLGLFAPAFTGMLMGHGDALPMAYNIVHLATGLFGLLAGYTSHAEPWMTRSRMARTA